MNSEQQTFDFMGQVKSAVHGTVNPVVKRSHQCRWRRWQDGWEADCGYMIDLAKGTPIENGFNFCPYCGKELLEV